MSQPMIRDYISHNLVPATPEETEARQPLARRIVEEYGYPSAHVRTVPEMQITKGSTVVGAPDILVFRTDRHDLDNLYLVVETKRKSRRDGLKQLKSYLAPSVASVGVWFNGHDVIYLQKLSEAPHWRELPDLPRYGEAPGTARSLTRSQLIPSRELRSIFRTIYYRLYTNSNLPRAERLAAEVIRLLFCKLYDELNNDPLWFSIRGGPDGEMESGASVFQRVSSIFDSVRDAYSDVFKPEERLSLDAESVSYVVGQLQRYALTDSDEDAVGDAFEVFLGPSLRGEKGQFFTPRTAVRACVDMLRLGRTDKVIDPACGSGGFLIVALEAMWRDLTIFQEARGTRPRRLAQLRSDLAADRIFGIDREVDLAKISKAYMAMVGDGRSGVFRADSLDLDQWTDDLRRAVRLGMFTIVLTNPPFGADIKVDDPDILQHYDLALKWVKRKDGHWEPTGERQARQDPQTLFLELCVRLLAPDGRMAIVLPEGMLANPTTGYILEWVRQRAEILAIVDAVRTLFQPSCDTKTVLLLLRRRREREAVSQGAIFCAITRACGHDRRGKQVRDAEGNLIDDFPAIAPKYLAGTAAAHPSRMGFLLDPNDVVGDIYIPRYYDPEIRERINALQADDQYAPTTVGELLASGVLAILKGHEVGAVHYGTGPVPFVRSSDISNWEITHDPTHSVSAECYEQYRAKQRWRPGDVLFVNDGRLRIGKLAMLMKGDTEVLLQSHFRILRVKANDLGLTPYLLLYLLSGDLCQDQIRSKTVVQSTIATLGDRLREVVLPIPRDGKRALALSERVEKIIATRAALRQEARQLANLEGVEL